LHRPHVRPLRECDRPQRRGFRRRFAARQLSRWRRQRVIWRQVQERIDAGDGDLTHPLERQPPLLLPAEFDVGLEDVLLVRPGNLLVTILRPVAEGTE
jgi:hypothetical protein